MINIVKDSNNVWAHYPDDRLPFISGAFQAVLDGNKFRVYSRPGRLYGEWQVGQVTVTDNTSGGATFSYANNFSGAIQLAAKLISLEYPGIKRSSSGGGGGTGNVYISQQTYSGSPLTVVSGLADVNVFNRNAMQETVSFTYSGTSITITSGAVNGDELLIIANNGE